MGNWMPRLRFLVVLLLGRTATEAGLAETGVGNAQEEQAMSDASGSLSTSGGIEGARSSISTGSGRTSAEPVTVDLGRLPRQPGVSGRPEVAPAPGVPDPRPRIIRDAKIDLGARVGADISEIELTGMEATDWPDTSLGCPTPGELYAQVETAGYRITLVFQSREYIYHTDGRARVVFCPAGD